MIYTELKFSSLIKKLDELVETLGDLSSEENSIFDDCHDGFETCYQDNGDGFTLESVARLDEIDAEMDVYDSNIDEIRSALDLNER